MREKARNRAKYLFGFEKTNQIYLIVSLQNDRSDQRSSYEKEFYIQSLPGFR